MSETSASPTLAARLNRYDVHLFAALDTIDEIARRITNLVSGRDLTVVRQYVGSNRRTFPDVSTNLRVDTEARGGGILVGKQPEHPHCGLTVYLAPGLGAFGVSGAFATEREAAERYHDSIGQADALHQMWALRGEGINFVHIVGGQAPGEIGRASVIEILRINENDVAEQIVVKPSLA